MHLAFILLGKRYGQTCDYILIHILWLMVWLNGQELEMNMIGKLVTRKYGEEVCEQTSLNGQQI